MKDFETKKKITEVVGVSTSEQEMQNKLQSLKMNDAGAYYTLMDSIGLNQDEP